MKASAMLLVDAGNARVVLSPVLSREFAERGNASTARGAAWAADRAGTISEMPLAKDDLWHPLDELDLYVPPHVESIDAYVRDSYEYAMYCLIFDETIAYGYAELDVIGRWQTERQAALDAMPYDDYLLTPEWAAKRVARRIIDGGRCRVCDSPQRPVVHHRRYPTHRGHEDVARELTTLCRACHDLYHENGRMPVGC